MMDEGTSDRHRGWARIAPLVGLLVVAGCQDLCQTPAPGHGPIAEDISAPMGEIIPSATDAQRETFERGLEVSLRRFDRSDGLGPAFNLTFCGGCHEKPTFGGSAGLYRNFFLAGQRTDEGAFFPVPSAGEAGGVIRMYAYDPGEEIPARPAVDERTNVIAQRNPIPFFGVGLLASLPEESILGRADPDDEDGDGVSGRPNYDRGFVGRFGMKSQTVSIEGFIRGPLFNHLGITTDPLTEEQRANLPVDSSGGEDRSAFLLSQALLRHAQAAAPDGPLNDDDGVPDPELSTDDLFDLVSFAMLLAAPEVTPWEELTDVEKTGLEIFDEVGCQVCHAPRIDSNVGPLPVYSDLLIHDMGEELADGLEQREASGSEFRTQPLWGLSAVGPYLHDGRATTIDEAIRMHGGEGDSARIRYERLPEEDQAALVAFLESLGGKEQFSPGLIPPNTPVAAPGEYGGPYRPLNDEEAATFLAGRDLFDFEFGLSQGAGGPRMNGDSCRACHFDPVVGGSGPRGVNVMRHGILNSHDEFTPPAIGTILHKTTSLEENLNQPQVEANIFEHRNTPHLFGLGLIESIPESEILENADPADFKTADGITGRASFLDGGRLGRFGWKAQVPSMREFVRDAVTAELGMTLPFDEGQTFGKIHDNDDVPDPEMGLDDARRLEQYLLLLAGPPRQPADDQAAADRGEQQFEEVGCAKCHVPSLEGADGPVPLYSDLLLHEILPEGAMGIEEGSASMREFRTPPLWGLSQTAPYLHSGAADTIDDAIRAHDGEAVDVRDAYEMLSDADRADLLAFLDTL